MSKENEKPTTIIEALIELQAKIEPPAKSNENEAFKRNGKVSKYADLGAVWDSIKPHLQALGLFVSQPTEITDAGMVLRTVVTHKSGAKIESTYLLNPVKQDPQGMGSAITYARRYALCSLLGIVADDDDDGNAASGQGKKPEPKETPEQVEAKFIAAINEAKTEAELEKIWPVAKRTQKPNDPERHARVLAVFNTKLNQMLEQGGN
jgi:hypothetical protein